MVPCVRTSTSAANYASSDGHSLLAGGWGAMLPHVMGLGTGRGPLVAARWAVRFIILPMLPAWRLVVWVCVHFMFLHARQPIVWSPYPVLGAKLWVQGAGCPMLNTGN